MKYFLLYFRKAEISYYRNEVSKLNILKNLCQKGNQTIYKNGIASSHGIEQKKNKSCICYLKQNNNTEQNIDPRERSAIDIVRLLSYACEFQLSILSVVGFISKNIMLL